MDNILYSPGDQSISPNEWVQLHHYQMQEAVKRANNRIKLKAAERKKNGMTNLQCHLSLK